MVLINTNVTIIENILFYTIEIRDLHTLYYLILYKTIKLYIFFYISLKYII